MSACFHIQGVECDNCRTGLNHLPMFISTTGTEVFGYGKMPNYGPTFAQQQEVDVLRDEIDDLRATLKDLNLEVKRLQRLVRLKRS